MKHPERVEDYLEHVVEAIARATTYAGQLGNVQALELNPMAQDAIVRNITIIGGAVGHIQKHAPAFLEQHPELPWHEIRGMRNSIAH